MTRFSIFVAAVLGLVAIAQVCPARAAVVAGQVDDFENGTLQDWQAGGFANPNGPANVATGGPAGLNDNFLRLSSNGGGTAGGKLVVFNSNQWAGNYSSAGVAAIQMQVNNTGNTNLVLRLILENSSVFQSLGTVTGVNVPAGSGWTTVSFPLTTANLTGGTLSTVLSNVTTLDLVHSPNVVTFRNSSPNIAAQLGVDNIRAVAVPEPGSLALAVAGSMLGILAWRRSRAGRCS